MTLKEYMKGLQDKSGIDFIVVYKAMCSEGFAWGKWSKKRLVGKLAQSTILRKKSSMEYFTRNKNRIDNMRFGDEFCFGCYNIICVNQSLGKE